MVVYHPSFEEFSDKARRGNLIPVYTEILADLETPVKPCQLRPAIRADHSQRKAKLASSAVNEIVQRAVQY